MSGFSDNLLGLSILKVLTSAIFGSFLQVSIISGFDLVFSSAWDEGGDQFPFVTVGVGEVNQELIFGFGPDVGFDVWEKIVNISVSDLFTVAVLHVRSNDGPFGSVFLDEFNNLGILLGSPEVSFVGGGLLGRGFGGVSLGDLLGFAVSEDFLGFWLIKGFEGFRGLFSRDDEVGGRFRGSERVWVRIIIEVLGIGLDSW